MTLDAFSLPLQSQPCHVQPSLLTLAVDVDATSRDKLRFIHNVMERLLTLDVLSSSPILLSAYIEFQGVYGSMNGDVQSCRDRVKQLLSQQCHSNNLCIWLSYAAMEHRMGNAVECKRVLEKTAALSLSLPPEQSRYRFHIWCSLAASTVANCTQDEALHVLCAAVEATPHVAYARAVKKCEGRVVTPTRIVKADTAFHQVRLFVLLPLNHRA